MLGGDQHPALRHPTIGRRQDAIAIAVQQRCHGPRVSLSEGGLRFAQGRWDPSDPFQASLGGLLPVVLAVEGTLGHQIGGTVGGVQRRHVCLDNLSELWRITAIAAERFHQHGNPRLMRDNHFPHDLMEVWPMIPTLAARAVHDGFVGGMVAVIAAIDMEAGAIEMRKARGQAQTLGSRGRNETIEFGDAIRIERI
jgi:hypothetical protein